MEIIALGGGGFSMDENLALDRYILDQSRSSTPRVCFLPQASGEPAAYVVRFMAAMAELGATPTHLSLFRPPTADLASYLEEMDVIYVGGGNTRSMLALWREWQLDGILRDVAGHGTVLAGLSAGAVCWFSQMVTDSVPGKLSVLDGLAYLEGSACPHYDSEPRRRPTFLKWVANGRIGAGYGIGDNAALHFVDGILHQAVGTTDNAVAVRVTEKDGEAVEEPLRVRVLDKHPRRFR